MDPDKMTLDASGPPACLGPRPGAAAPQWTLPTGAWDTHFHVFGPLDRFPYSLKRKYTPPEAPLEPYLTLLNRLGIDRGVCVHPNLHGSDMSVTLDAMRRSDGRILGVAKTDDQTSDADAAQWNEAGISKISHETDAADEAHNWCIELHSAAPTCPGTLRNANCPVGGDRPCWGRCIQRYV